MRYTNCVFIGIFGGMLAFSLPAFSVKNPATPEVNVQQVTNIPKDSTNQSDSTKPADSSSSCGSIPVKDCTAAQNGDASAQEMVAYMYIAGSPVPQDYKKAVFWLTKAAHQDSPSAQYTLGILYSEGKGVRRSYKKAVYWVSKAANKNFVNAERDLGARYFKGLGVKQNRKTAFDWYSKAAKQGDARAQIIVGFMYALKEGIKADPLQGYAWITVGLTNSKESDQNAEELQKSLYAHLSKNEQDQAEKLVNNYLSKYKAS